MTRSNLEKKEFILGYGSRKRGGGREGGENNRWGDMAAGC